MNMIHSCLCKCLTGFFLILVMSILVSSKCTCEAQDQETQAKSSTDQALEYKLIGLASILVASALGVSLPLLIKNIHRLQPDGEIFFLIKAFAAGVILATGLIHILPDAFESLTSSCLAQYPSHNFPFTGFVAMMAAIATLMMESFATGYRKRNELSKAQPLNVDEETSGHAQGDHHFHGPNPFVAERTDSSELVRHRIVSQVLELGILVHSVIIGISLGASVKAKTVKALVAALSFHQFFEGMGLGGCISQAKFKGRTMAVMLLFFSITTPTGISLGIAISKMYNGESSTALVVEGILNSASAGILIYMALVDLLANDFMNPKMLTNFRLQLGANLFLVLGACFMSVLALWL